MTHETLKTPLVIFIPKAIKRRMDLKKLSPHQVCHFDEMNKHFTEDDLITLLAINNVVPSGNQDGYSLASIWSYHLPETFKSKNHLYVDITNQLKTLDEDQLIKLRRILTIAQSTETIKEIKFNWFKNSSTDVSVLKEQSYDIFYEMNSVMTVTIEPKLLNLFHLSLLINQNNSVRSKDESNAVELSLINDVIFTMKKYHPDYIVARSKWYSIYLQSL